MPVCVGAALDDEEDVIVAEVVVALKSPDGKQDEGKVVDVGIERSGSGKQYGSSKSEQFPGVS